MKINPVGSINAQELTVTPTFSFHRPELGLTTDSAAYLMPPKTMKGHKIMAPAAFLDSLLQAGLQERQANLVIPTGLEQEINDVPEDAITPVVNRQFEGNPYGQYRPPDNQIAISDDGKIVAAINSSIVIADENGTIYISQPYDEYFDWLGLSGSFHYDPKVLYDAYSDRFIMVTLYGQSSSLTKVCIHYSVSSDPLDGWFSYVYNGGVTGNNSLWFDYPNIGVSTEDLFVSGNLFNNNGAFSQAVVLQFDKDEGYAGASVTGLYFSNILDGNNNLAGSIYPLSYGFDGGYGPGIYLVSSEVFGGNFFTFYDIDANVDDNPLMHRFKIGTAAYTDPLNASQNNTSVLLDGGDCRIKGGYFGNDGYAHFVHATRSNGYNRIRYTRFNVGNNAVQNTTFGLEGYDYVYPAVAPFTNDPSDQSVIVPFLRSAASTYPEFRAFSIDNNMDVSNSIQVAAGQTYIDISPNNQNVDRWGDYIGVCRRHNAAIPTVWALGQHGTFGNVHGNWIAELSTELLFSCSGNTLLTDCASIIEDGSGATNYTNNLNCSWTISPPGAVSVTLEFTTFDTEFNYDFVKVYDGDSNQGILLGEFSGDVLPPALTANSGQMYIEFSSDNTLVSGGWSAFYSCSTTPATCTGNTLFITCNAFFDDGSDVNNYSDNLDCSWVIAPPGAVSVTLSFQEFNTEFDYDFVSVYDGLNSSGTLLGTFSGNTLPPDLTSNSGQMFIRFTSDGSITRPGWTASYSCTTPTPPIAGFTANPSSGIAPLSVNFNNTSTNATSYAWAFPGGNPGTSTAVSPQNVVFSNPGTYTVTLTATGPGGVATSTATITVNSPAVPIAAFTATPGSGTAPLSVNFNNTSTNANSYAWSFPGGNPNSSNATSPQNVVFSTPGTYNVTLTATGPGGAATATASITVNPTGAAPVANFSASNTCVQVGNGPVSFTDLSQNIPTTWSWQFPGGTPSASNLPNPAITYNTPGVYDVILTVSNASGTNTVTKAGHISVVNVQAQTVSGSNSICIGESVLLSANGANTFLWQGSGLSGNSGSIVSATPTSTGSIPYTVVGTTGNCADAPVVLSIQVNPVPVVNVFVSANEICLGNNVILDAQGADTYEWTGPGLSATQGATVTATPTLPGSYTYTVKGTSNTCASPVQAVNILVKAPPSVSATASTNAVCQGNTVTLTATGASQYSWTGPGLSANSGASVTATPPNLGTNLYTVVGTAVNGCSAPGVNVPIVASGVPVVQAFANPMSICLGDTVWLAAAGADQYQWSGAPGLLANSGNTVKAVPETIGTVNYSVVGTTNDCSALPKNVAVQVENNPLSVDLEVSGCPGPNLVFTANVTNGGSFPNILWHLNGATVWSGPSYTLFGAVNGSEVYCSVGPVNQACTSPNTVQSAVYTVNCIVSGLKDIPEILSAQIMPNPNSGVFQLHVASANSWSSQLRVFNTLGQLVLQQPVQFDSGNNTMPIILADVPDGMYWLVLESEGRWWRKGFVVQAR
jgi:PKD repeat protein